MLSAYAEHLALEPRVVAGILAGGRLDPAQNATEAERLKTMKIANAFRRAVGHDPASRDTDPLVAGFNRWLHVIGDATERETVLADLLDQIDEATAQVLRAELSGEGTT
jgi:hypothetical protein